MKLHDGLKMTSPVNASDPSRKIKSSASVNDNPVREGVAKQPKSLGPRTA